MLRQNVHNALNTIKCNMAGCGPTHEQRRYTTEKEHFASHTTSTLDNTAQPDLSLAFSIQMQRFRVLLGISRMSHRGASAGSSARFWNAEEEGIANAFLFATRSVIPFRSLIRDLLAENAPASDL